MNKSAIDRAGSIYIIVVGAAMLIVTFMMAGLMLVRIQRSAFQNSADIHQSRLYAESAIDLGLHHIRENQLTWRSTNFDFAAIYGGYPGIELSMVDPIDGDLTDSYDDPVLMVATGSVGSAIQKIRARLNLDAEGYSSLESALHSGGDINVNGSVLNLSESLSYDDTLTLQNSLVNSSVTGANSPSIDATSQIEGAIVVPGDSPKGMPSSNAVDPFSFYMNAGVVIDVDDLWLSDHSLNRMANYDFSQGLSNWEAIECTASLDVNNYANITERSGSLSGLAQDVTSLVYADATFHLRCGIYNQDKSACIGSIVLRIETNDGVQYFSTAATRCKSDSWTQLDGVVSPQWTGRLVKATWLVNLRHENATLSTPPDYSVVLPTLRDVTYPDGSRVIKNQLLSPNHNPFGSGFLQKSGIYVLDADLKEVYIENTRVLGTLVLRNSDSVRIRKSVNMSSFVYNYPVLMAQTDLSIGLGDDDLDEQLIGTNLNPVDAGYVGDGDVVLDDVLENRIDGLVYVHRDLEIDGSLESSGVWIVNNDVTLQSATLTIDHRKLYAKEPPPGFVGHTDLKVLTGSFSRSFAQ